MCRYVHYLTHSYALPTGRGLPTPTCAVRARYDELVSSAALPVRLERTCSRLAWYLKRSHIAFSSNHHIAQIALQHTTHIRASSNPLQLLTSSWLLFFFPSLLPLPPYIFSNILILTFTFYFYLTPSFYFFHILLPPITTTTITTTYSKSYYRHSLISAARRRSLTKTVYSISSSASAAFAPRITPSPSSTITTYYRLFTAATYYTAAVNLLFFY